MLLNSVPPRTRWHQRPELGLEHRHAKHRPTCTAHEDRSQCSVVLGRAWPAANNSMGIPSTRRENGWAVDLHCSRREGEVGCQWLVVGECEVAPDDVLRGFERKVGLRVGWSNKGCVWRRGLERALRGTRFGAVEHRAENGDEKLAAFLGEGIAKRAKRNS
jgi:hypothetical protein